MKVPVDATPVAITDEEKASKDNGWQHLYFVEYRPSGCKWLERPPLDLLRVWTDREVDRAQPHYSHGWPMLRWHSMAKTKLGKLQGAKIQENHRRSGKPPPISGGDGGARSAEVDVDGEPKSNLSEAGVG